MAIEPSGTVARRETHATCPPCFDAGLAVFPTRVLPVAAVIDLLQVTHAPARVAEYRWAMQRGALFPPISVVRLGGRWFVADGHKRLSAYKSLGGADILVEVWTTRRWLRDQQEQLSRSLERVWRVVRRGPVDSGARADAAAWWRQTGQHWRRIARSLASRWH